MYQLEDKGLDLEAVSPDHSMLIEKRRPNFERATKKLLHQLIKITVLVLEPCHILK